MRYWPEALVFIIEIALFAIQFVSGIIPNSVESIRTYGAFITGQVGVLAIYIILKQIFTSREIERKLAPIDRLLDSSSEVNALLSETFYDSFLSCISQASNSVAITHLDPNPPSNLEGSKEKNYYEALHKKIKSKTDVVFQRVERISPDKIDWIESFISKHTGGRKKSKNFSLSCIKAQPTEKIPHISTQLVDNKHTFLVAIAASNARYKPRDIYIQDKEASEIWRKYYDDILWKNAVPVIENGVLNRKNWEELKREYGQ